MRSTRILIAAVVGLGAACGSGDAAEGGGTELLATVPRPEVSRPQEVETSSRNPPQIQRIPAAQIPCGALAQGPLFQGEIASTIPAVATGVLGFRVTEGCVREGAPRSDAPDGGWDGEAAFLFTAPRTGSYVFDCGRSATSGRAYVLDACDTGAEPTTCRPLGPVLLQEGETVRVLRMSRGGHSPFVHLAVAEYASTEANACNDLVANDLAGDGTDCADPDCADDPSCTGSSCVAVELGTALPATFQGDVAGALNRHGGGSCGAWATAQAASWSAPRAGQFAVRALAVHSVCSAAVYVRRGTCNGEELACQRIDVDNLGVELDLQANETIVVFVGESTSDCLDRDSRPFLFTIEAIDR